MRGCTHPHRSYAIDTAIASATFFVMPSLARLLRRRSTADIRGVARNTGKMPVPRSHVRECLIRHPRPGRYTDVDHPMLRLTRKLFVRPEAPHAAAGAPISRAAVSL